MTIRALSVARCRSSLIGPSFALLIACGSEDRAPRLLDDSPIGAGGSDPGGAGSTTAGSGGIGSAGTGGSGAGSTDSADSGLPPDDPLPPYRQSTIVASDIAWDASRNAMYAAVPGDAPGALAQLLVAFSPATDNVIWTESPGFELTLLALSGDGSLLWGASREDTAAVRTLVDLEDVDLAFGLGPSHHAQDIVALPGQACVLSLGDPSDAQFSSIRAYDEGVARGATVTPGPGHWALQAGGANTVYALDVSGDQAGLLTLETDAAGIHVLTSSDDPFSEENWDVELSDGWLIGSDGGVVDAGTLEALQPFDAAGALTSDVALASTYFASRQGATLVLEWFNRSSRSKAGELLLDAPNVSGEPSRLVRWGQRALALLTDQGELVTIDSPDLPSP